MSEVRFMTATSRRKPPDTTLAKLWPLWAHPPTCPVVQAAASARPAASARTTLEWPSEKKNPTLSGGRSVSPPSLRVTLSIAAMWSASNACRIPSE